MCTALVAADGADNFTAALKDATRVVHCCATGSCATAVMYKNVG